MSFDWKDFIRLAKELIKQSDEASLRSGISGAYYGVFCILRNKKGLKDYKKSDVHLKVITLYINSSNPQEKRVGSLLDELRKRRNDADYNEDKTVDCKFAQRAIEDANNILEQLGINL
jgi:uncharacterized protein (UPF0332 family)